MAALICPRAATTALRSIQNTRLVLQKTSNSQCFQLSKSQSHHQYHTALRNSIQPSLIISKPSITAAWSQQQQHSVSPSSRSTRSTLPTTTTHPFSTTHNPKTPSQHPPNPNLGARSPDTLTWNRFFEIRRSRRRVNFVASVATAIGSVVIFGPLAASQDIDGMLARATGLDPLMTLGLAVFAIGGVGWLCGPSFGSAIFRFWTRRKGWANGLDEKEKSFFDRIKRYRANPAFSSPQNPIVDYYGEKITSVKDYRRWMKDQKTFNKKKDREFL